MGRLTGDMTRLREEINAARDARLSLIRGTKYAMAAMRADVAAMKAGFHNDRLDMARHSQKERSALLNGLKKTVRGLRKEVVSDLAGVRRAWSGKRP